MKFLFLSIAISAASFFTAIGAFAVNTDPCFNCHAEVTLSSSQAKRFTSILQTINSIPLNGKIISTDYVAKTSRVMVYTLPAYAKANDLNSFDVAKILSSFTDPAFGIKSIQAGVTGSASDSAGFSNVGTIGHR